MFIFNNIIAKREKDGKVVLYIDKPETFLGKEEDPDKANLKLANTVGWNPGTPKDMHPNVVQNEGYASILEERAKRLSGLISGRSDDKELVLADNEIKLRGYGAGLAIMAYLVGKDGEISPRFYFPQRDITAPGDRLVWDTCSGRTDSRNESFSWLERMILEGMEELTFTYDGKLVFYKIGNVNPKYAPRIKEAKRITRRKAKALGIPYIHEVEFSLMVFQPNNAVKVYQRLEDGETAEFYATPMIESKFSGLELAAYGIVFLTDGENKIRVWDSEEFKPGSFVNREVHEIDGYTGDVRVFHKGEIVRESDVNKEIERRNRLRTESKEPEKIPSYNSTLKADVLTKKGSVPYDIGKNPLDILRFG